MTENPKHSNRIPLPLTEALEEMQALLLDVDRIFQIRFHARASVDLSVGAMTYCKAKGVWGVYVERDDVPHEGEQFLRNQPIDVRVEAIGKLEELWDACELASDEQLRRVTHANETLRTFLGRSP